jgi:hypothetical protein
MSQFQLNDVHLTLPQLPSLTEDWFVYTCPTCNETVVGPIQSLVFNPNTSRAGIVGTLLQ